MSEKKRSALTDVFRSNLFPTASLSYQCSAPAHVYSYTQPATMLAGGYANAASKIAEFANWATGWDGEEASQISQEAANRAQYALQTLSWQLPVPEITPNSNGTVSLEWETPYGSANIEIGRTRYAGYVSSQGYPTHYFDEVSENVDISVGAVLHALLFGSRTPVKPITSIEVQNVA